MFDAILWGLIQGLTEFLPISSSGHLVLVPALLGRPAPDLATSALLHLGTLAAVLVYFRREVATMVRFDRPGRRLLTLLVIGTIPAAVLGLALESPVDALTHHPKIVASMLVVTGVVLLATRFIRLGSRTVDDLGPKDAILVGLAQSVALVPGISRSGMTISASLTRAMDRVEAARWAFLLGIPAIAGAGALEMLKLIREGAGISAATVVGMIVAGLSGYAAIAFLIRLLGRHGLAPFGVYCVVAGAIFFVLV